MRTCEQCSTEKPDSAFRPFGRGRKKVCRECEGGSAVNDQATPPEPVTIKAALELPAGFGFRATIESGRFCLEQDAPTEDGGSRTDNITLMPHEARRLVEWLQQQVEGQEAA